jgi:hypothetical protein
MWILAIALQAASSALDLAAVVADPSGHYDKRLRLCGEIDRTANLLYVRNSRPGLHGRPGLVIRGTVPEDAGRCLTGRVLRADGLTLGEARRGPLTLTDAGVDPQWVFVLEK